MDKIIYLGDAKAAVRTIIYDYNGICDNRNQYGIVLDAMNRLDRIPPATKPDIIYCPDCEYSCLFENGEGHCDLHYATVSENDFCSFAGRRE